jgi:hypothetical protein
MSTQLVDIKAQLAAELATLNKTVAPPSGHRISLKGKTFTFPDGKTSPGPIAAVILDWRTINAYYKGAYNPQKVEAPSCFAISKDRDDLKPSPNCSDPQSEQCEGCAWNEWGSAPGGGRGKACKNQIRIAVVPPDAKPDTPPWTIDLAPSSTGAFTNMVNNVKGQLGMLPLQVQVSIDFDANESYPKLTFADPEPLPEALVGMMFEIRKGAAPLLDKEPGS